MRRLSQLLQSDTPHQDEVHRALLHLGLVEIITGRQKGAGPTLSTKRAESLIRSLATDEPERQALFSGLDELLQDLGSASDPMRALVNLSRLVEVVGDRSLFYAALAERREFRMRLCRLLAFSQALADALVRQPELLDMLRQPPRPLSRAALRQQAAVATESAAALGGQLDGLRRFRKAQTLRIGLLDMESQSWRNSEDFELLVHQISDLAQVCVEQTLRLVAGEAGCKLDARGAPCGFAALAMGKLGARELNYSSDIDLIFVRDDSCAAADRLGERLLKELGAATPDGTMWRVDMRLRPEGQAGPLVTPLDYALSYYESYAAAWEWQALIKARVIAGDARLGRRFRRFTRGITWAKRSDDAHLREIVDMKRRSEATAEGSDPANVKQGPGGIRDAEWTVQQLQMMVGPDHPRVRAHDTLRAVEALHDYGALSYHETRRLRSGYLFMRVLEHRLQLLDERAVRTLPSSDHEKVALARRMGCPSRGSAAMRWLHEEHERHRRDIRALCERMFWGWQDNRGEDSEQRPIEAAAPATPDAPTSPTPRLTPEAQQRVRRLAGGTANHPLPAPLARQIRSALPDVLRHLDHAADGERALTNLERLCDASGNRLSLLRSLGEAPTLARAVLAILGGSEFLSDTLIRYPELLDLAAQRTLLAEAKVWPQARADCRSYCLTFRDRKAALRRWKGREMLRIGLRDLVLNVSPLDIITEISDLAQACLSLACEEVGAALRPGSERIGFCVLGLGKLGGGEMHYASDADVLFSYQVPRSLAREVADEHYLDLAARWASELTRTMSDRTEEGVCFVVDARLRPEGRSGQLAPPISGYLNYFERASGGIAVWERQALTRARYVAGNAEAAAELMAAIRHVAFPAQWQPGWGDELRHIKDRVEHERAARGTLLDVKLGPGALNDIEFCAQWLALKHGVQVPELQTTNTLGQIQAAHDAALLTPEEACALRDTYIFLRRAELRLQITQGRSIHAVPRDGKAFTAWVRAVYPDEPDQAAIARFDDEWQRRTAAAREVMERVRQTL